MKRRSFIQGLAALVGAAPLVHKVVAPIAAEPVEYVETGEFAGLSGGQLYRLLKSKGSQKCKGTFVWLDQWGNIVIDYKRTVHCKHYAEVCHLPSATKLIDGIIGVI